VIWKSIVVAGCTAALVGGRVATGCLASAQSGTDTAATPGTPGAMNIGVSAGEKVDTDGTQGSFAPAIQGTQDSDGDQDAFSTGSWEAAPQDKPHQKGQ